MVRRHGDAYRAAQALDRSALRVMGAVAACRTAALGGHVYACERAACGFTRVAYNSCRNRHCPKCQSGAAREWLDERAADLLPVEYFHVVFTLPPTVAAIAKQNKAVVYGLLFEAASQTLKTIAADPRHLGAEIGMTMVLHTWGQTLTYHPHVHVIVPGGGLSPDKGNTPVAGGQLKAQAKWIACRPGFFLPVKVLQRLYRRLFLEKLGHAHKSGRLQFFDALAPLEGARAFARHLAPVRRTDWIVYAKKPFAGPEQVLRYLARYTHRIAISNRRLVGLDDTSVSFTWKDYRDGAKPKRMTLAAFEFIRRFLLHVLPEGFQRIRHYGFLANGHRREKLGLIRRLLDAAKPRVQHAPDTPPDEPAAGAPATTPATTPPCPCCGGPMRVIEILIDPRRRTSRFDTS